MSWDCMWIWELKRYRVMQRPQVLWPLAQAAPVPGNLLQLLTPEHLEARPLHPHTALCASNGSFLEIVHPKLSNRLPFDVSVIWGLTPCQLMIRVDVMLVFGVYLSYLQ
eukprot:812433-Amphidinium_carterae.1